MSQGPYIWTIAEIFPDALIGQYVRERSPDRLIYRKGEVIEGDLEPPVVRYSTDLAVLERWDVIANDAQLPIVGTRAAEILSDLASHSIQLLPISIEARDRAGSSFRLLNITRAVRGIDHANSEYSLMRGTNRILGFRKLCYETGCLGDLHVARDAEYRSHILVSGKLRAVFERAGISGVDLLTPEERV